MIIKDLVLESYKANHSAVFKSSGNPSMRVSATAEVLRNGFVTRYWLDKTLIKNSGKECFIHAEVENDGKYLIAKRVWLSTEGKQVESSSRGFKNFALELHKPKINLSIKKSRLVDFEKLNEQPIKKLSDRFDPQRGDLVGFKFDNLFLEELDKRNSKNIRSLFPVENIVEFTITPDWRLVVGLGQASVYETNISIHHTYGVPFIPSSGIKGVLREYVNGLVLNGEVDKERFEVLFGENEKVSTTGKAIRGKITFFDAFPLKAPRLELDVMTPHYPDYYGKGKPPADWQSPNPVHFLTIGKGSIFRIRIGLAERTDDLIDDLKRWFMDALSNNGFGAKTAVGYGYLKLLDKEKYHATTPKTT